MNLRIACALFLLLMTNVGMSAAQSSTPAEEQPPEVFELLPNGVRIGQFDLRGIKTWGEFLDRYPQVDVMLEAVTWYEFGGEWHPEAVVRDRKTHEALFVLACGCAQPEGSKGKTKYFNGREKYTDKPIEVPTFREAIFTDYWAATTNPRYQTPGGVRVGDTLGKMSSVEGKIWVMFDLDLEGPFVSKQAEYLRVAPKRYEAACLDDDPRPGKPKPDAAFSFVLKPPLGALIAGMYGKDLLPGEYRNTSFITEKYRKDATIKMITTINRCHGLIGDHEGE